MAADFVAETCQRVSMPLVVTLDADLLVIKTAIVSKAPQAPQTKFAGMERQAVLPKSSSQTQAKTFAVQGSRHGQQKH